MLLSDDLGPSGGAGGGRVIQTLKKKVQTSNRLRETEMYPGTSVQAVGNQDVGD